MTPSGTRNQSALERENLMRMKVSQMTCRAFVALGIILIAPLASSADEQAEWERTLAVNTIEGYRSFYENFPHSAKASEARIIKEMLDTASMTMDIKKIRSTVASIQSINYGQDGSITVRFEQPGPRMEDRTPIEYKVTPVQQEINMNGVKESKKFMYPWYELPRETKKVRLYYGPGPFGMDIIGWRPAD